MERVQAQADGQQQSERDQETRRRILKAAERLFLEKGFKGVSMKAIAEAVHVTSAALYYHFPAGKDELFVSMVKNLIEEGHKSTIEAISQAKNLQERLVRLTEHNMLMMAKFHSTFEELRRDIERYSKDERTKLEVINRFIQPFQQILVNIFQQGIDAGEIASDVPASVLAWIYAGSLAGIQHGRMFSPSENDNLDTRAYVSLLVSTLLDGMRHPKTK
jgi:AcrR family transcriptional regulator